MMTLYRSAAGVAVVTAFLMTPSGAAAAVRPKVLRVCNSSTYACPRGTRYASITDAIARVLRYKPRPDRHYWILVWPGVYHEKATATDGVLVTTPNVHIRGMDRNLVIVDGSNGSANDPCPSSPAVQDFSGRDGIKILKVDGTSVDNLTVCNYLPGPAGGEGNQIWWNGGDGSGMIGMGSYSGSYMTATSMFYAPGAELASYGIFVSNASGPGVIAYSYASNMADSSFYVGACPDCNAVVTHVHAQNSALGYSGTNAGGHLRIEDSEWDLNKGGIVPSSLNNDDAPPPQSGLCPPGSPEGTGSCTFFQRNYVHDNNNPNVPLSGLAGQAPVGAGIEIVGGQFDTIRDNRVENQGAWGIVTHDYPDTETPPPVSHCEGGQGQGSTCLFVAMGNEVSGNQLANNGFFGNPTNGDLANESSSTPKNCFFGNTDPAGLSSEPAAIETVDGQPCDQGAGQGSAILAAELACDAGLTPCPPGSSYPPPTGVQMLPLARQDPMPDPCAGVQRNRWCPRTGYAGPRS